MQLNFINIIEILGTFAFAVSGAFSAMERKLDLFGVLIISFVTAIGGGTLRDMLLGNTPVAWLENRTIITVILLSASAAIFFGSYLKQMTRTLFTFDAFGLGLFTIIGIEKGLEHNLGAGVCIALGTVTGCFGGVTRDVLLNNVPLIFKKEIYASSCIAGGIIYFLLLGANVESKTVTIICISVIVLIRILAVRYRWSIPKLYRHYHN
jgi:uncharacterized membrane protein YeiH